jgi:transcription-repair coupling factor (superfamily II helicase)
LPNDYVVDTNIRLNLYRRLSMLDGPSSLADMEAEIKDRFGPLPHEVKNLLALMSLRLFLKQTGISRLDTGARGITLTFSSAVQRKPETWIELAERNRGRYQFLNQNTLKINTGSLNLPDDLSKIRSAIEKLPLTVEEQGLVRHAGP